MSYQVLARKWRPRSFKEMAGQSHVLKTLINSLDNNRLHHAYLFTGTRGVGKTTIARILARCLNCETGVTSEPCGECGACREIDEGRFIDLIEVDAASRTKVEDTRELLDNVQYSPTRGRYKVYLIDEVHMLSGHSFNALLKTLEEPPPHVKFLLATTDPQKLPVTVLSRCLQFNLKNLSPERLVEHIKGILEQEDIPFEEPALWQLGRAAQGSVRDCLTLLDQAIAFCDGNITETEVSNFLGTIDQAVIQNMLKALSENNAAELLKIIAAAAEQGPDFTAILLELQSFLHRIAIAQVVPDGIDNSLGDKSVVMELAGLIPAENVQLYYQMTLKGREELPFAMDPRAGLEMTLLRMLAFTPAGVPLSPVENPGKSQTAQLPDEEKKKPELTLSNPGVSPENRYPPETAQTSPPETPVAQTNVKPEPELASEPTNGDETTNSSAAIEQPPAVESEAQAADFGKSTEESQTARRAVGITEPALDQTIESEKESTKESTESQTEAPAMDSLDNPEPVHNYIPLHEFDADHWIALFYQLEISGITRSIASNCILDKVTGTRINLLLDESQASVYNEEYKRRIEAALGDYFETAILLEIKTGPITRETPASWRQRQEDERNKTALETFSNDAGVTALLERFSGEIQTDSIEPLTPKNY